MDNNRLDNGIIYHDDFLNNHEIVFNLDFFQWISNLPIYRFRTIRGQCIEDTKQLFRLLDSGEIDEARADDLIRNSCDVMKKQLLKFKNEYRDECFRKLLFQYLTIELK